MTSIVLLGGNGYIGREVTRQWLLADPDATFHVVSGSGKNNLTDARIVNVKADATSLDSVRKAIPAEVDYIVDFVGRPEKDPQALKKINMEPAKVMKQIAEEKAARKMGFIGGILGPKSFTGIKSEIIEMLKTSSVPLAYVEPTLLYGAGRKDSMTRMVPILKVFGVFSKKMRPMRVENVAAELVAAMTAA